MTCVTTKLNFWRLAGLGLACVLLSGIPAKAQDGNATTNTPPSTNAWDRAPGPGIVVSNGTAVTIFAGSTIHVSYLVVQPGGRLLINHGINKFTNIKVTGDCSIHGRVELREFLSGSGPFTETAPDGSELKVFVSEKNIGGQGGNGQPAPSYNGAPKAGGRGAFGTESFGGGGGSGGGFRTIDSGTSEPGVDAVGQRGGVCKSPVAGDTGGDGGARPRQGNGGYLYLRVECALDMTGGIIDVSGTEGGPGQALSPSKYGPFAGGGGGGPGGQGGVLYLRAHSIVGGINVNAAGGKGGRGGAAKASAESGKDGEDGFSGQVNYL